MRKLLSGAIALAAGLMLASSASAETTECTEINTIPFVITVQGVYCLKKNLVSNVNSGNLIDIQTNNVTIDFNGFKLGGLAAGPSTTAVGVYAVDRKNITLKNGNIRGFLHGVLLQQGAGVSSGHVIEDNLLDGNLQFGIRVQGTGIVVRINQVVNTSGGTAPAAARTLEGITSGGSGYGSKSSHISNIFAILGENLIDSQIKNNIISSTMGIAGGSSGI